MYGHLVLCFGVWWNITQVKMWIFLYHLFLWSSLAYYSVISPILE